MSKLFLTFSVIFLQAFTALASVDEPVPWLIWAATDPAEDAEAAKINATKFYEFGQEHLYELAEYYKNNDVVAASILLATNGKESGTDGVNWAAVMAKLAFKRAVGASEDAEHGLPSLVIWAIRNTGSGTEYPSVDEHKLVKYILSRKADCLRYIYNGDVDGLIEFLEQTKSESGSESIDWRTIILGLTENRQLFEYSCGILNLQLCNRLPK
ncbi:uncharacterized protein LOC107370356 [Tetranychus urticae]|uniref:Sel1 repeat family protein n=1 Tax=Tetranychus urticae TaxID=32264 RepID=T1L578_TETUR|nr:uncharacterized protein LOC107370356 [Tetranychus urticae]